LTSASTCVAVGTYYSDQTNYANGLLLDWSGGSWTPKEAPLPANADASEPAVGLAGVSCPSVSRCEVIGDYYGGNPVTSDGLMLTWSGGSWTVAQAPSAWYAGLSCASAWSCVAIDNTAGDLQGGLRIWSDGSWSTGPFPLPANGSNTQSEAEGSSCPAVSYCVVAGEYTDTASNADGLLLTQ